MKILLESNSGANLKGIRWALLGAIKAKQVQLPAHMVMECNARLNLCYSIDIP
jgi:hypothetical protein